MKVPLVAILLLSLTSGTRRGSGKLPLVINTWAFTNATKAAWHALYDLKKSLVDTVEVGCSQCETDQCDTTVGYGGSPDENGETTLDAMIFDGDTMNMGAVAGLRNVKSAASVARCVMEYTRHSILAGELASQFAFQMGFKNESLSTDASLSQWKDWRDNNCQPNFWLDGVKPDPKQHCGPYAPGKNKHSSRTIDHKFSTFDLFSRNGNHDTISMAAIDRKGSIVVGTSSNGAKFKIPGRIGDAPLPGAGAYAVSHVGAGLATGDGDAMMRFLPAASVVDMLSRQVGPQQAATKIIQKMARLYPDFSGALIAVKHTGEYGAACHNLEGGIFPFSVAYPSKSVFVQYVKCINNPIPIL